MNTIFRNKKIIILCLSIVLLIGIFYIGRFIFDKIIFNKSEEELKNNRQINVSEKDKPKPGFTTADELDAFLDCTSWEGTDKNGNKIALMFLGDTGAEYKMIQVCKMEDEISSALRVSYYVVDGKTILYDAKKSSSMIELECLVSADRKSLVFESNTYYKKKVIDWIE